MNKEGSVLKKFVIITPVWGAGHIKLFLDIGLPSLLAPDNIPKLSALSQVKYFIYTKAQDAHLLRDASIFQQLETLVDVSLIIFEDNHPNNHSAMSWCHKLGFQYTVEHSSYAVFIPPDCIWSNQALLSMFKIVEKGYKIIHMSGIRIISDFFYKALMQSNRSISLAPRELVRFALQYLHPITLSHFFDEKEGGLMPANLFWSVDETGIIARCFHLHPLLVYGTEKKCDFKSTIDDDLALAFNSKNNEEYIVADSDELIAFEMSPLTHKVLAAYRKGNINDIAMWAAVGTNTKHRFFIKKAIKIHSENTDTFSWTVVEQKSDLVVKNILITLGENIRLNIRHVLQRMTHNKLFNKVVLLYLSGLRAGINLFHRSMRSNQGHLYPWHWNYPFQADVCNPFLNELKQMSGNVLYFDDKYLPLIHAVNYCIQGRDDLEIDLSDFSVLMSNTKLYSRVYENHYDLIVIRDFDLSHLSVEFLDLLKTVLKSNGRLIYYVIQPVNLTELTAKFPKEMKFVLEQNYGGLGTKKVVACYHWYYKTLVSRFAFLRRFSILNTCKLIVSPILILFFPLVSITTFIVNVITKNNKIWAVKRLNFYRCDQEKMSLASSNQVKDEMGV